MKLAHATFAALTCALAACAAPSPPSPSLPDALLLGEQHDLPSHQRLHRLEVERLAGQQRLAALALEMAEQGASTADLPATADESTVRAALAWDERGWPWSAYGPAVMAAVRAGVPVLGANLPRALMRGAMAQASLDGRLEASALASQREAVRVGHCGLLPEAQIAPMTRVQIARDVAMAQTVAQAARPGQVVVLLAGSAHVDERLGVPRHLPSDLRIRAVAWPAEPGAPAKDHCAELKQELERRPSSTP